MLFSSDVFMYYLVSLYNKYFKYYNSIDIYIILYYYYIILSLNIIRMCYPADRKCNYEKNY